MPSSVPCAPTTASALPGGRTPAALFSSVSVSQAQAGAVLLSAAAGALICIFGPTELPELAVSMLGAFVYAVYHQTGQLTPKKKKAKVVAADLAAPAPTSKSWYQGEAARRRSGVKPRVSQAPPSTRQAPPSTRPPAEAPRKEYRQESVAPVSKIAFQNVGWELQVPELLEQIRPNEESDRMVEQLVRAVQRALRPLIPEAEVVGCASGNVRGKRAFGVAVPEVDIVMTVSPAALIDRLKSRLPNGTYLSNVGAKKLQKAAIRACADQLVSAGRFKFRRSAFRVEEPKFTLLAPTSIASGDYTIAIDFSVNAATPLQGAALFREVTRIDQRASDVILLMRRWARDRGISHAARGHLSPYGWTLLATYFLQTGAVEGGSGILPALPRLSQKSAAQGADAAVSPELSAAELFKRCLLFYSGFSWRKEGVSARLGRRAPPGLALPVHVALSFDGKSTHVAPNIEDPFDESRNIAASMTADGVVRFGEELLRASKLIAEGASLSELLELWAPDEKDAADATTDAPSD